MLKRRHYAAPWMRVPTEAIETSVSKHRTAAEWPNFQGIHRS